MTQDPHGAAALYVAGALDAEDAAAFEAHVSKCAECAQELAELQETAVGLSESVATQPPEALRGRLLDEIAHTPQESPEARPTDSAQTASAESNATVVALQPWRRLFRPLNLVAAAAVIVILGLIGWGIQSNHQADVAQSQQQQLTRLLTAPDVATRSAHVAGGGTATLLTSEQRGQALLVTHGLPTLPDNKVYQLWTITRSPASAGTMQASGGTTTTSLPTAALSAAKVAMTIEPAGGSPQPTTKPVFAVAVPSS